LNSPQKQTNPIHFKFLISKSIPPDFESNFQKSRTKVAAPREELIKAILAALPKEQKEVFTSLTQLSRKAIYENILPTVHQVVSAYGGGDGGSGNSGGGIGPAGGLGNSGLGSNVNRGSGTNAESMDALVSRHEQLQQQYHAKMQLLRKCRAEVPQIMKRRREAEVRRNDDVLRLY
jgi:hypothetical protein